MFGLPLGRILLASIFLGLISLGLVSDNKSSIFIYTDNNIVTLEEHIFVDIKVSAKEPANVFKGKLLFDPAVLSVVSIDYNTSVADLWAEEPWYSNGEGTLSFLGGTTKSGGFVGTESLMRVSFRPIKTGETGLSMSEIRILRHDGIGSDIPIQYPLDEIFTINATTSTSTLISEIVQKDGPTVQILSEVDVVNLDLNNDGKQSVIDVSIFMVHLATQNLRSDFNRDGVVDLKDLSILTK